MGIRPIFARRYLAASFALLLGLLVAPVAHAGVSTTDTKVTVVTISSLVKTADLDFGSILPGTTAGTVTIAVDGTRTKTGGVTLTGGTPHEADFSGRGAFNQRLRITILPSSITITNSGGNTMTVNNFVVGDRPAGTLQRIGPPANPRYRITSATGIFDFPVGARLNVGANQAGGVYQGSFTVDVIYE